MKKAFLGIVVIAAIVVVGLGLKNNTPSQPAQVNKAFPVKTTTVTTGTGGVKETTVKTDNASPVGVAARKKHKVTCVNNGDGTITVGTADWHGWWIFGSWQANPATSTVPGGDAQCAAYTEAQ